MRRVCPAENGILNPSGGVFGKPCTQYVQKLWYLRCSPSVITGDLVASNLFTVSRTASSYSASSLGSDPSPDLLTAEIKPRGRGTLPTGSVGMCTSCDWSAPFS